MLAFVHSGARLLSQSVLASRPGVMTQAQRTIRVLPRRTRLRSRISTTIMTSSPPASSPPTTSGKDEEVDPGEVAGTSLRILHYPHPLLRAENAAVPEDGFDDELKRIVREMLLIMYASKGVGLAAPQVGINLRLLVFNPEGDSKAFLQEVVMINPTIVGTSKKMLIEPEGCLSFPEMSGEVKRHEWVKVEGYRLNGKKFKVKFEGWKARIFQHEYDHLDGVMYVDRLEEEERVRVREKMDELIAAYKKDPYEGMEPAL